MGLGIIILLLVCIIVLYNKLIKLKKNVEQSFSGIDVYLKQRFDLIPNLVECVKGYSKHEKEVLEKITQLRSSYNANSNIQTGNALNREIDNILMYIESNPELKASDQYLKLQKALIKVESQLQASRRLYNNDVRKYNYAIEAFPTNLIASFMGLKEAEYFTMNEEEKSEDVKVKL